MKYSPRNCLLSTILMLLFPLFLNAQTTIEGIIIDEDLGEPLINASVLVKGTTDGTIADFDGNFIVKTEQSLPLTLIVSFIGYETKEVEVTSVDKKLKINLGSDAVTIAAVEIKGRRISEKQQQAALTVETLDGIGIKETPSANFYDGLGSLKDVDLTAASLGFKIINTRGFNSTSPVRSLQIIDGVDNQSPGLNFSLGNFLGSSELDVNRVNLVVGASSAFYGPNAFNGVISMETKNPFVHKGLSAMVKGGERNLFEGGFRYADALRNKNGHAVMAFKLNFFYFSADDWVADNYDPVFDTDTDRSNPGGYDAVNIYGDEFNGANDYSKVLASPGLGIIHRKGYREIDLVDYDSNNMKLGAAVHFRLQPEKEFESPEFIIASNYSTGTTVYQGDNRFSLRNIQFYQHRLELQKRDKYFFRVYATHEDAGDSYDPYFTALLLQSQAKEDQFWRASYKNYWDINIVPKIKATEGYPNPLDYLGMPDEFKAATAAFLGSPDMQDSLVYWHSLAQVRANEDDPLNSAEAFYEPGTPEFEAKFNDITSKISFAEGGTKFYDKSALVHAHGEYRFNDIAEGEVVSDLDLIVGANYRMYLPDSRGSLLLDTFGRDINTYEYGIYGGGTMEISNRLKVNASLRADKNQNFDLLFSPAASLVYTPVQDHTMRASFSSAIRNPTLGDQYLFYNVGRAILIGNLDGFENLITVESLVDYLNTNDTDQLVFFDVAPIRPEKVKTFELGYRTTLFNQFYADATYYYSFYRDFIGYNLGVDARFDQLTGNPTRVQAYRVAANAVDRVTTQGFSIGLNFYFWNNYVVNGNYSWNKLNTVTDDPIIPAFNTPEHKYNIGISGRDINFAVGGLRVKNLGFNVNYKWIDSFIFEGSPQFSGKIPSYSLLDAQVNIFSKKLNSTFKLGASNILNTQTFQAYGGPRIGRLAYLSITYEFKKQ
jgi:iron complex outermembrane receptor protein